MTYNVHRIWVPAPFARRAKRFRAIAEQFAAVDLVLIQNLFTSWTTAAAQVRHWSYGPDALRDPGPLFGQLLVRSGNGTQGDVHEPRATTR